MILTFWIVVIVACIVNDYDNWFVSRASGLVLGICYMILVTVLSVMWLTFGYKLAEWLIS